MVKLLRLEGLQGVSELGEGKSSGLAASRCKMFNQNNQGNINPVFTLPHGSQNITYTIYVTVLCSECMCVVCVREKETPLSHPSLGFWMDSESRVNMET